MRHRAFVVVAACLPLLACLGDDSSSSSSPDASVDGGADAGLSGDANPTQDGGLGDDATLDATVMDATTTDAATTDAMGTDAAAEAGSAADASSDAASDGGADAGAEAGLGPGPVAGAGSSTWPEGIVALGGDVYWLTSSDPSMNLGVFQTCNPNAGNCGSPTVFQGMTSLPPNTQLATDGTQFYFPLGGISLYSNVKIATCPVGSCSATTVGDLGAVGFWDDITGVAADATNVYYAAGSIPDSGSNTHGIWIANKSGTPSPYSIVTGLAETANIAVDASLVYFGLVGGGIYTCPISAGAGGCTPTLLQQTAATSGLTVDATYLYWGDPVAGAVYRCPVAGCGSATPTTIASGLGHVNCLAIDGSYILYTVGNGADAGATNGIFAATR